MHDKNIQLPTMEDALPGRPEKIVVSAQHYVNANALLPPFPKGLDQAMFGLGCFWGAEKEFWQLEGVYTTAVGYASGLTPNPTYEEVCSGLTGHNEVVWLLYDPTIIAYQMLVKKFWGAHDPTQGMRQGNDRGTQYRSGLYFYSDLQLKDAQASQKIYQVALDAAGLGKITTEIVAAPEFYYAEDYHQQYLAKNPSGYCGLGGTGVSTENLF